MHEDTLNTVEIGTRFRELRHKKHKQQGYMADRLYISPSYLSQIESGKKMPKLDIVARLSQIADVSIDYIVFGEDNSMNIYQKKLNRMLKTYDPETIDQAFLMAEYFLKLTKGKGDEV